MMLAIVRLVFSLVLLALSTIFVFSCSAADDKVSTRGIPRMALVKLEEGRRLLLLETVLVPVIAEPVNDPKRPKAAGASKVYALAVARLKRTELIAPNTRVYNSAGKPISFEKLKEKANAKARAVFVAEAFDAIEPEYLKVIDPDALILVVHEIVEGEP